MSRMYELTPQYDAKQSFYGKAHVIEDENGSTLQSYSTEVARYTMDGEFIIKSFYSATTTRHIKEFAKQMGIEFENKKDLEQYLGDW